MGECNFDLNARFETDADARAAEPQLLALLSEGEDAYHFWQDSRKEEWNRPARERTAAAQHQEGVQFWAVFRDRFPLVCDYLGGRVGIEDWNNGLAGQRGQFKDPQRKRRFRPEAILVRRDAVLFLQLHGNLAL